MEPRIILRRLREPREMKYLELAEEDLPLGIKMKGGEAYIVVAKPKGLRLEKAL